MAIWNHVGESVVQPFSKRLSSVYYYFSYFSAPPPPLPPFLSPLLSQCDRCPDVPVCVGAHGWVARIASNGSVLLTGGSG